MKSSSVSRSNHRYFNDDSHLESKFIHLILFQSSYLPDTDHGFGWHLGETNI